MRVCPKCRYIDPAEWKHCKYSYHIDTCTFENFQRLLPDLAKNLKRGGDVTEDELYYYRVTKTKQYVERKAKLEWTEGRNPFGAEKYEKFHHGNPHVKKKPDLHEERHFNWKVNPNQRVLFSAGFSQQEKSAEKPEQATVRGNTK